MTNNVIDTYNAVTGSNCGRNELHFRRALDSFCGLSGTERSRSVYWLGWVRRWKGK